MTATHDPDALALFRRADIKESAANAIRQDRTYWLRWSQAHIHDNDSGTTGETTMQDNITPEPFTLLELNMLAAALTVHDGLVTGLIDETDEHLAARTSAARKVLALYEQAAAEADDTVEASDDE